MRGKPSQRREPIDNTEHNTLALSPNARSHSFYIVGSISGVASPDWTVRYILRKFFFCSLVKINFGGADGRTVRFSELTRVNMQWSCMIYY